MGFNWIGLVVPIFLIAGVGAVLYWVSFSKRLCPNCRTMMPKKVTTCPKCGKQIPLNY